MRTDLRFGLTWPVKAKRDSGFIQVSVESRTPLECSDVELVRIFERYFSLVGDRLGHDRSPPKDRCGYSKITVGMTKAPLIWGYDVDQMLKAYERDASRWQR